MDKSMLLLFPEKKGWGHIHYIKIVLLSESEDWGNILSDIKIPTWNSWLILGNDSLEITAVVTCFPTWNI